MKKTISLLVSLLVNINDRLLTEVSSTENIKKLRDNEFISHNYQI